MLLMGWNLDSMLRAEFSKGEEMISLFEPAYPSENALQTIVNCGDERVRKKLRYTFGLPGYWVQPAMANLLLNRIEKLETLSLKLGRGFPEITTHGIDALLNLHYGDIGAEVVIPPLALSLNDPLTSLTRTGSDKFGLNDC